MAISLKSLRRSGDVKPPFIALHAVHGIGKTTLAASMPAPVFLQTEDGLGLIQADTFGLLTSFDDVMQALTALYDEPHQFRTVVLDSLDWLEPLVWAETCRVQTPQWRDIEQPGFGKGYLAACNTWRIMFDALNTLRDEKGMAVMLISHTATARFDSPEVEAYDRYQPKLQKTASALLQERADCVWFLNYRVSIIRDDKKDSNSRARGAGGGQRVLYTTERPSHLAKNRYRMPESIILPDDPAGMWPAIAKHVPYYNGAAPAAGTE